VSAPVVCTIGTSDPWNAAGIGLDARVFGALGVRGVTVVAAVSAQDARGVRALRAVDPAMIDAQFESLADAGIAAYRVGALADDVSAATIARHLERAAAPAVYDPVLGASGGGRFADATAYRAICSTLAPAVALMTPNLMEARAIAGDPTAQPAAAARAILALDARAVLITGIERDVNLVDELYERSGTRAFVGTRIAADLRGTGCMLAAAIAAGLARNEALATAIERARAFVRERIVDGEPIGGMRVMRLMP
jgi:hydroxymethylpyrimidine/phosphomethylpyrimidine kinase